MEFKDWLKQQLDELGMDPTGLARLVDKLNQPTIQRVLSGETPNPRIGTVTKIKAAVAIARENAGLSAPKDPSFQAEEQDLPPEDVAFVDDIASGLAERDIPEHIRQTILTLIGSSPKKDKQ